MTKNQCLNWNKIIANALFAFFSALVAANITGNGFFGWEIGITNALIMGGLSLAAEMKTETDGLGKLLKVTNLF